VKDSNWALRWSWCDLRGQHAHIFKAVRTALADLEVCHRNAGAHRGKGGSSAVAALTVKQYIRIENLIVTQINEVEEAKERRAYLGVLKKNGNSWYGDVLEKISELVMLDLAKFGGGRAQQDPASYSILDIYLCENEAAYYALEGEWRKTTRTGGNGNHIGKGPFCVVGVEAKERMVLLMSGRGTFLPEEAGFAAAS
jgi:hypothetical protein